MKIIYAEDYEELSKKAANIIAAQITLKPDCVLGLATGSSPIGVYNELINRHKNGDLDFSACHTVNLDEYCGLGKNDDQSYAYFMYNNLFKHININMANTNVPSGLNPDIEGECKRYDAIIKSLAGIDLQLLGIGNNGHIAFNEPSDEFPKGTHCVELKPDTIAANKRFFKKIEDVPTKALTMGIKSIMSADKILLIASGIGKAEILYKAVCGPVMPQVPASVLQMHKDVTVIADAEALSVILEKAPEVLG